MVLSTDFESTVHGGIRERKGKRFLALTPEKTQELLGSVREAISGKSTNRTALVTRTEGIRPFVRRIVELEFPRLQVISSAELRPELLERLTEAQEQA